MPSSGWSRARLGLLVATAMMASTQVCRSIGICTAIAEAMLVMKRGGKATAPSQLLREQLEPLLRAEDRVLRQFA